MTVDAVRADGRMVVSVEGELDIATVPAFSVAVREHLAAGPVLLDLGAVSFMDSSGVRALTQLVREADSLVLASELHPTVRQVLQLTGVLDVLPFEGA